MSMNAEPTIVEWWRKSAEGAGLTTAPSGDDDGVILLYARDTATGHFPAKVGLIVIRGAAVTYAELDGRVFDSITSDPRPVSDQLLAALAALVPIRKIVR